MAINAVPLDAIVLLNTYTRGCFQRGRGPRALGSLSPAPPARSTASPGAPRSPTSPPAHPLPRGKDHGDRWRGCFYFAMQRLDIPREFPKKSLEHGGVGGMENARAELTPRASPRSHRLTRWVHGGDVPTNLGPAASTTFKPRFKNPAGCS